MESFKLYTIFFTILVHQNNSLDDLPSLLLFTITFDHIQLRPKFGDPAERTLPSEWRISTPIILIALNYWCTQLIEKTLDNRSQPTMTTTSSCS